MEIYNIGTGVITDWDIEQIKRLKGEIDWVVTHYGDDGCYGGEGEMVVKFVDETYTMHNMGHCSCYGPTDEMDGSERFPIELILEDITYHELKNKLVELLENR